jgi:uncharacterized protein
MLCPSCRKPTDWKHNPFRPFCSERCKLVDFGRWVNEEYRVPDQPAPKDETESSGSADDSDLED